MCYAIEIDSIQKQYQEVMALDAVSCKIKKGNCVGLVGPNGAGKTTLLEILQGIRIADSGSISIFGEVQNFKKRLFLERIGVSSQNISLSPSLTVRELFKFYSLLYDKSWAVGELIKRIELEEKANTRFGRLSAGQKRRVAVALAVIGRPELLILDEPTGELDPQARRFIWELIHDENIPNRTVLLATHHMDEVEAVCDEVLIIDKGRILDFGSPGSLVMKHCPDYRLSVEIAQGYDWKDLRIPDMKISQIKSGEGKSNTFEIRVPDVDKAQYVIGRIREMGGENLINFSIQRRTLDDVFISLTGRGLRD